MEHPARKRSKKSPSLRPRWLILVAMLALTLLAGSLAVLTSLNTRARGPLATPTATVIPTALSPSISVSPTEGSPGTLVVVAGEGWPPGEELSVYLNAPSGDQEAQVLVAFATVTEDGRITAPFFFPSDARLNGLSYVLLRVWSPTTGDEGLAILRVLDGGHTPQPEPTITPTPTISPPTPTPVQPQSSPTHTPTTSCVDQAAFVSDVTIPDNTYLSPGRTFVKTWRLRNTGTCTWTTAYSLAFVDGHSMGGPLSVPLGSPVAPGKVVDVSVTLNAPTSSGTYEGKWRLRNANGTPFGTGSSPDRAAFWVRIVVGPTPTLRPSITAWRGEYYSDRYLSGAPAFVRDDAAINFDWGTSAPGRGIPANGFSARWTRTVEFEAGTYRFHIIVDDGARLWLDDRLILDTWHDGGAREVSADDTLGRGTHLLRVEFYEHIGDARIRVWWDKVTSPSYPDWKGEYWSNRSLKDKPTLTRNDKTIDFQWRSGAAAPGLPIDNFSARWSRRVSFGSGVYRFYAQADDGIRLYINDDLVLDEWHDSSGDKVYTVDRTLTSGQYRLKVEYYERSGGALAKVWWKRVGDWPTPTPTPNRSPVAKDDAITMDEDTRATVNVLSNDADPDGDTLTIDHYQTSCARGGIVSCIKSGICTYTPPLNFNGSDTFAYTLSDGRGRTDAASVAVIVNPVNDPPVAMDDTAATIRNTSVTVDVLANDSDPDGDSLIVSDYRTPSTKGGTVNCTSGGICTYAPPVSFIGSDMFTYVASDGKGGTDTGTVRVLIDPVNAPPVAVDDTATTDEDSPVQINVLTNDSDPDGDTLSVSGHDTFGAQGGTVSCTDTGLCTYTPPTGFNGSDIFAYTVSDGNGGSDSGVVTVKVGPIPTQTPTVTPTPTSEPTATPTVTPTPTPKPTATPEPTPTPISPGVRVNEVLPVPDPASGTVDLMGEWIELYNAGSGAVDLSGWFLDNGDQSAQVYWIPEGTILQAGAFLLLHGQDTGVALGDDGGQVRLNEPDGEIADVVTFGQLAPGASYSLGADGTWHNDWPPSPGEPNLPPESTPAPEQSAPQLWAPKSWPMGLLRARDMF